jgi:predicted nucleic acid-binding protein
VNAVFIDTGYLVALESAADQHHARAVSHWLASAKSLPLLVTTSFIFDEVVTFLNSRGQHAKAVELGTRLMTSPSLRFIHVDDELFRAGWEYFRTRPDKRYSLTDCVSFVVMERLGLRVALTFDAHFEQAGFRRLSE